MVTPFMEIGWLLAALVALSLLGGLYFGYSFRGWLIKWNKEERRKMIVSILIHIDKYEREKREEFFNFIEGLKSSSKSTN